MTLTHGSGRRSFGLPPPDPAGRPNLRIALCGYEGEHVMPPTWECLAWSAPGGWGNQRKGGGNVNRHRERIWFSPHCLPG